MALVRSHLRICTLLCFAVITWFDSVPASAQARKEINSLTPAELQVFRDGVAVMKLRNVGPAGVRNTPNFRRSWEFWANIHGYFGVGCETAPMPALGMAGIDQWQATNLAESQQWCKCAHKTPYFLVWHRMFLLAFERVLREAAVSVNPSNPIAQNLTLPYWDIQADARLPAAFRDPRYTKPGVGLVDNPLYVAGRAVGMNAGTDALQPNFVNNVGTVLSIVSDINGNGRVFDDFATALEQNPHGSVHCAISVESRCANGMMGKLASAANDPIFWLHHANIDRIYDCWLNHKGGVAPTLADGVNPAQAFDFINPSGTKLTLTVGGLAQRLASANVSYIQPTSCTGQLPPAPAPAPAPNAKTSAASPSMTNLDPDESKEIANADGRSVTVPEKRAAKSSSERSKAAGSKRVRLAIKGVTPDPEGRLFDVYLVTKKGPFYLGTIEFFSSHHPGHHHKAAQHNFEFDATQVLAAAGALPGDKVKVVVRPTSGLVNVADNKAVPSAKAQSSKSESSRSAPKAAGEALNFESISFE